ncbi:D-alanyl-D-alanine dipeptidase [Pelagibius litoralis]|uniref:D-alanyl-D-alanine dipeptidase n=1 Tax=Pelagibius litoralis TaxID=374515 RepID=A0A967KDY4_9PROT|nr:D-alanyl-D-alanine dipeptidase [Pelagibius litoralis]NIA72537.1 D-alanyl-D-alanine dipeptidase [Pelagibius litoralis]
MTLIPIAAPEFDVEINLAYATSDNITGKPIYRRAEAQLHPRAAEALQRAIELAAALGLRFRVFDAYRPVEAQWQLWQAYPDPEFIADPRRGSNHSRGVAVDLTLIDGPGGAALDMGTPFDDFRAQAHHGRRDLSADVQRNRAILLGLMTAAGWDWNRYEWWHYQLFDPLNYPLLHDAAAPCPLMA